MIGLEGLFVHFCPGFLSKSKFGLAVWLFYSGFWFCIVDWFGFVLFWGRSGLVGLVFCLVLVLALLLIRVFYVVSLKCHSKNSNANKERERTWRSPACGKRTNWSCQKLSKSKLRPYAAGVLPVVGLE